MYKCSLYKIKENLIINSIVPLFRKNPYLVALLFGLLVGIIYFYCA